MNHLWAAQGVIAVDVLSEKKQSGRREVGVRRLGFCQAYLPETLLTTQRCSEVLPVKTSHQVSSISIIK